MNNNKELDECMHFDGMICMNIECYNYGKDCDIVNCDYKTVEW